MHLDFWTNHICVVGPDEEAIGQLGAHFNSVIDSIVANTWEHYSVKARGKGPVVFDPKEMGIKGLQKNPSCFLLQPASLRRRLLDCRASIVTSFRMFSFDAYNAIIATSFGPTCILDTGSGIEALFPSRPVGRPKRQKLSAQRDRKDPSTYEIIAILGQAIGIATKELHVLVRWSDAPDEAPSWIPATSLTNDTQACWALEVEKRFPWIDFMKDAPMLRITGGPVTLVFDDTSDATA